VATDARGLERGWSGQAGVIVSDGAATVDVDLDSWEMMVRRLARGVVAKLGHDRAALQLDLTVAELAGFTGFAPLGIASAGSVEVNLDTWPRMLARMTISVADSAPSLTIAAAVLGLSPTELRQRLRLARRLLAQ
jgi:hypothetical protein